MKHTKTFTLFLWVAILFLGCQKDETQSTQEPTLVAQKLKTQKMSNLYAPQITDRSQNQTLEGGDFVKFDFSAGDITTSDTDWDIAFRGTTILVNGGSSSGLTEEPNRTGNAAVYVAEGAFDEITSVTPHLFRQDQPTSLALPTGSGKGWYTYDHTTMTIRPIAGKVLIFRTADNKYAKVEILSFYKDSPNNITPDIALQDARYYTFNYVYQNEQTEDF